MNDYDVNANIEIIISLKNTSKSKSYSKVFSYYEEGSFLVIELGNKMDFRYAVPISMIDEITIFKRKDEEE